MKHIKRKLPTNMSKGRPIEKKIPTVVVYKKSPTAKKHYLLITEDGVDEIINDRKKKPLLPSNYEIVDMGIGESFIDRYKQEYNIK